MSKYYHKDRNWLYEKWEVKTLILGTFNPENGPEADYYYGRVRGRNYSNQFWPSLESYLNVINKDIQLKPVDIKAKIEIMQKLKFYCRDLIKMVETINNDGNNTINNDFSDRLILKRNYKRQYYTNEIITEIKELGVKRVITSWGKGTSIKLKEFQTELKNFQKECPEVEFKLYHLPPFGRPLMKRERLGKYIYEELLK